MSDKHDKMSDKFPEITHWDFRVVKEKNFYNVREVYYVNEVPVGWTQDECGPAGENGDELLNDMDHFQEALERPVVVVDGDDYIGTEPELWAEEGVEMPGWMGAFGALFVALLTIGAWELLKWIISLIV